MAADCRSEISKSDLYRLFFNTILMKRRIFIRNSAIALSSSLLPQGLMAAKANQKLRIAHIGVGNMGLEDLKTMAAHPLVEIAALCDVDATFLAQAGNLFPNALRFKDYRDMITQHGDSFDAVVVSTPDHTHAPASLLAMEYDKAVYCQKPLAHYVSEVRAMKELAAQKNLVTQMGIQVHSFYDYKLATFLIQGAVIGKVTKVIAWSNKNWGYDGSAPTGEDPVPDALDWNLWLGTSKERPYKQEVYHPMNWRKLNDYGCATLGDMGVHIFDTPYNALNLDVPKTVKNECRKPNDFGFPERNIVTYTFPGTPFTTKTLTWVWYDGEAGPDNSPELELPNGDKLPDQGAMFIGKDGRRLLLPHFMELPRLIVNGQYQDYDIPTFDPDNQLGEPVRDYAGESPKHYHEFVDACLGKASCSAPFSYSARLSEAILLGVVAGRFPGKTLHWDSKTAKFRETEANAYLSGTYRKF